MYSYNRNFSTQPGTYSEHFLSHGLSYEHLNTVAPGSLA